jgi:hypothetical protein
LAGTSPFGYGEGKISHSVSACRDGRPAVSTFFRRQGVALPAGVYLCRIIFPLALHPTTLNPLFVLFFAPANAELCDKQSGIPTK